MPFLHATNGCTTMQTGIECCHAEDTPRLIFCHYYASLRLVYQAMPFIHVHRYHAATVNTCLSLFFLLPKRTPNYVLRHARYAIDYYSPSTVSLVGLLFMKLYAMLPDMFISVDGATP